MTETKLAEGHTEGDGCDLEDEHDRLHHESDLEYCSHPECRADGENDDRKVGLL